MFGGALSVGGDGVIVLSLAAAGGLNQTSGLAIKLDTGGNTGLVLASTGLKIYLNPTEPGLSLASGIKVLLASNPGLELSSGLKAKVAAPLALSASGIGLTYSTGLYLDTATLKADHDAATNFVADEHVAHGGVSISSGTGLTGGGDITTTRSLSVDRTTVDGWYSDIAHNHNGTYARWRGSSATDPATPLGGDMYLNTGDSKIYLYNGTAWEALT
jgi:hypothetical protein